jgi:hypothetical protein
MPSSFGLDANFIPSFNFTYTVNLNTAWTMQASDGILTTVSHAGYWHLMTLSNLATYNHAKLYSFQYKISLEKSLRNNATMEQNIPFKTNLVRFNY